MLNRSLLLNKEWSFRDPSVDGATIFKGCNLVSNSFKMSNRL